MPRPSGGRLKFTLNGPTLIVFEGVPLCAVAMIPDEVDRVRDSVEPRSRRLVLDAETEGFEGKLDLVGHDDAVSCYVPGSQLQQAFPLRLRPVVSLGSRHRVSPQVHHGANADAPSRDQRTAVQGLARNAGRVLMVSRTTSTF
jgi:hypothetical protein